MQVGARRISYRGDGPWRGMTTQSKALPGHFELLDGMYVSSDGSELRMMPGWKTVLDPVTNARTPDDAPGATKGYECDVPDARRPVSAAVSGYKAQTNPTETLWVWSELNYLHGFEQVHGRFVLFGETRVRREPIHSTAGGSPPYVKVTAYTYVSSAPPRTTLTVQDAGANGPVNSGTALNALTVGAEVLLSDLGGPAAALLNNKKHVVNAIVGTAVTIETDIIGAGNNAVGQSGFIDRLTYTSDANPDVLGDDKRALTIWTSLALGDPTQDPSQVLYPAYVANRRRDFGDATGSRGEGNTQSQVSGRSRRRQKEIPYRLVPHVAGNRLIMAAPGYGCVFQAPVIVPINFDEATQERGLSWVNNDIYDMPRALGVPKAVVWEDPDKDVANCWHIWAPGTDTYAFGGAAAPAGRDGVYQFVFVYRDDATGEVGLPSEIIKLTTTTAAGRQGVQFLVLFPGYLLHESLALSVDLYRTIKNGNTFYFDRSIPMTAYLGTGGVESAKYGLEPQAASAAYYYHVLLQLPYTADTDLQKHQGTTDVLRQMPMGAKCGRTARGWTLLGGALGTAGPRKEMVEGTLTLEYTRNAGGVTNSVYYNPDDITSRNPNNGFEGQDGQFGCSVHAIPPAYAGQMVFSRRLLPYPRQLVRLNKLVNTVASYLNGTATVPPEISDIRYQIVETPLVNETDYSDATKRGVTSYLLLPRALVQISERDQPGVTPATNGVLISNEGDEDVEAIGDMMGQAVVCTRSRTFMLAFSDTPVGAPAEIASDRFGCIAPNTMVSFDGGCAWISDRGPCAMIGGAFRWIGRPLEHFFVGDTSRYRRDGSGMMRHAFACHDAERALIWFGLFTDRGQGSVTVPWSGVDVDWTAATDEARSRFPCDELLVYSYYADAWSIFRPPDGFEWQWMASGQDDNGDSRVFFADQTGRIYALDDSYAQWNREPTKTTIASASTGVTITTTGTFGQTLTNRGTGENYIRNGMTVIVTKPDQTLVTIDTVQSFTSNTITLSNNVTVAVGDFVHVGARTAELKTNFLNLKGTEASRIGKVAARYNVWSKISADYLSGGLPQLAFAQVSVTTSRRVESVDGDASSVNVPQTASDTAQSYTRLGLSGAVDEVQERGFARGASLGQNHRVEMTLVGGAQVRLHDLYVEVQ